MNKPQVSVLMAVRDAGAFLRPAVDSILDQSLKDLELVVVDDGSSDGSEEILRSFNDARVRVFTQEAAGQVSALNAGIGRCTGEYIARMDADDISLPDRLAKQASFLDGHPDHVLVGCRYQLVDGSGLLLGSPPNPTEDEVLRFVLPTINPFAHGSVLMRRSALVSAGGYRDRFLVEDYDLWLRLRHQGRMASLDEVLYLWTLHPLGVSARHGEEQRAAATALSREAIRLDFANQESGWNLHAIKTSEIRNDLRPLVAMSYRAYAYECFAANQPVRGIGLLVNSIRMSVTTSRHSAKRLLFMLASLVAPGALGRIPPREYP